MPPHAYGVGLAKTGTTSLARAFSLMGSSHERSHYQLEPLGLARLRGQIDDPTFWRLAGERLEEPSGALDVCSSHHFYADALAARFPAAVFLWTVRDVRAWSNSLLDMEIREAIMAEACGAGETSRRMRFPRVPYVAGESFTRVADASMLPGLIRVWSEHMVRMARILPPQRVMQVRTHEINSRLAEICTFIGADSTRLIHLSTPANARPAGLAMDRWSHSSAWHEVYRDHAAVLMQQLFPEEHGHIMALITQPVSETRAEQAWSDYVSHAREVLVFPSPEHMARHRTMLEQAARTKDEVDAAIAEGHPRQLELVQ